MIVGQAFFAPRPPCLLTTLTMLLHTNLFLLVTMISSETIVILLRHGEDGHLAHVPQNCLAVYAYLHPHPHWSWGIEPPCPPNPQLTHPERRENH